MQDPNTIVQIISTVGFPIVMCLILMYYIKYKEQQMSELQKAHMQEMMSFKDEFKLALNNNTIALNKLCEKIEKGDSK